MDGPARKVRKSLVLDPWGKDCLNIQIFQEQLNNAQVSRDGHVTLTWSNAVWNTCGWINNYTRMTERFFKLLPDARWKSSDKFFNECSNPWAGGVQPFVDAWPRGACSPSSLYQPPDEEASRLQQNIQTRLFAGEENLVS